MASARVCVIGSGAMSNFYGHGYSKVYFVNCSAHMHARHVSGITAPQTLVINNLAPLQMSEACYRSVLDTKWSSVWITELENPRLTQALKNAFASTGQAPTVVRRSVLNKLLRDAIGLSEIVPNISALAPSIGVSLLSHIFLRLFGAQKLPPAHFRVSSGIHAIVLAKTENPTAAVDVFGFSFEKESRLVYADGSFNAAKRARRVHHVRADRIAFRKLADHGIHQGG